MQINAQKAAEFMRFALVGLAATAIHYGVYYVLLSWLSPNVAYTVGYAVSFCCNYVLSSLFTFRVRLSARRGLRFCLSHLANWLIGLLLLNLIIWLGVPQRWAPLPVFVLVVPINFLLVRFALKK